VKFIIAYILDKSKQLECLSSVVYTYFLMFKDVNKELSKLGSVGIIATDTVYGLVARAEDIEAVSRLYDIKDRKVKPGTLIAANLSQLEKLGIKHRYLKAIEQYWPGPISVVIPVASPELKYLHQSKMSLAVRIPGQKSLRDLLIKTGPLLTSSANLPGQQPAINVAEAKAYFGEKVDFYDDGGNLNDRQPSTIIRVIDDAIEVIRQGAVKIDDATI
jgi:L-threonylcarbamoyladenylate synthase